MSNPKILILSNDSNFADEIRGIVQDFDYKYDVVLCESLANLKQEAAANIPATVIADVQLSAGPSGKNIMSVLVNFDVPIIFINGTDCNIMFKSVQQYYPVAYLVKPVLRHIIKYTLALALQKNEPNYVGNTTVSEGDTAQLIDNVIFVRSNNVLSKILIADIIYVSTEGNYSIIHAQDKRHIVKISLINMKNLLDPNTFLQVHRGYLVQMSKVDTINLGTNELSVAGQLIPIGRKYKEKLINSLIILK